MAMQYKYNYLWDLLCNPFGEEITKQPSNNSLMLMLLLLHFPQLRLVTVIDLIVMEKNLDESFFTIQLINKEIFLFPEKF